MFKYIKGYSELMEKIPCEYIVWNVLPAIRKEFAKSLMKNFNLNQKQVAEIIKLTPSAVSQYLSNKRGGIDITNKYILKEIDKSTRYIYDKGSEQLERETCRICNLLKSSEEVSRNLGYLISKDLKCEIKLCKNNELFYENIVWNILPVIRREFAKNLIKYHKLTQKKVADMLGLTEAAVSRYVSGKRGNLELSDKKILKEIKISTDRIVKGDDKTIISEICRICNILKSTQLLKTVK